MYIFVYTFVKLISTMKKHLLILATALISISTFAQIPTYVPANGLVGWWPFNGNANDESGNGNHGTVNGATLTQDRFGNANMAYGFTGNNLNGDDITCQNSSTINSIENTMSISVWVKPTQYSANYHPRIIERSENIGGNTNRWYLTWSPQSFQNKLEFASENLTNQSFESALSNFSLYTNEWFHIVLIFDQGQIKFYKNAIFQNSVVFNQNLNLNFISNASLKFGSTNANNSYFNGLLDDIGIWSRALSECEISDLYYSQLGSLNTNSVSNVTAIDSYTWILNGQTYTQSGTYTQTVPAANGCDSTITLNLTLNFTGMDELGTGAKKIVKITDLNGKIIPRRKNTFMLFIYEDGTVERVVEMEE